jgi:aspartyl-tRNA(Asn)/glutamyl-tRNA(Gln) amidotransferase subunit A
MSDELAFASLAELGALLRARRVSAVELARLSLDRLERLGPRYDAVVTLTRERALAEAAQADRELAAGRIRGPLHGIPYGLKDLIAATGYPTTWGAVPYRDQRFADDATVVARLAAAGAVLVAKLAAIELAGGMGYTQPDATFTGPGRSPWNTAYWSGGSSSGPGAAVAAGLVPFALGRETAGSILTPAAYSGVTGLRPTYGLVSRYGVMALSWTMDKVGPLARSAADCATVLAAIAGRDAKDPSSVERGFAPREERPRRFRIGVVTSVLDGVQREVAANFHGALSALADTAEVVPDVELPGVGAGVVAGIIIAAEASSAFEDLFESGRVHSLTAPEDRVQGYAGVALGARDYLRAQRVRRLMGKAYDDLLKRFDALAVPTRANVAVPLDRSFADAWPEVREANVIGPTNVVGVPAISVPSGFGRAGLPTAVSFVGRAFEEHTLVALARAYQHRTDWHRRRPDGTEDAR